MGMAAKSVDGRKTRLTGFGALVTLCAWASIAAAGDMEVIHFSSKHML